MFVILVIMAAMVAWLFVLAFDSRRADEQEIHHQTRMLQDEIAAHTHTDGELQRAKVVAENANDAKTRYLVAVSHEIRSPLNAIYGYAQLLERDGAISAAEAGAVIRRSAEHLSNLVEGLLEISRIESGVLKLRSDVVNLPALFEHVVDMFRMQAQAKGLDLTLVVKDRLPQYVRADEKRLRQILINLVSNAIKYTRVGGATITIKYRTHVADVEVSDTGIGIAEDDLERIFEPFERGSSPEAQLEPGIGLGLAITRVLARILGGEVFATSKVGVGSSFRLRLLLLEPPSPPPGSAPTGRVTGYEGPRRTVLVVDDNPAHIAILQGLLRPLDFIVYSAPTGADGIALAERCRPDLVLLDIQMPGMTGWEAAARLRAAHGDRLRIVMASANAHEFQAGGDGHSNHDAFITKPVDFDALLDLIGSQLRLQWTITAPFSAPLAHGGAPLPPRAAPMVAELRRLAKIGHVREVQATIGRLAIECPDAAGLIAGLRAHADNFDLRSVVKMLDDAEAR